MPMVFEPFACRAIVGVYGLHFLPECGGVVHISQVAQFMDDHIIRNCRGRQHKPPIERECSFGAAASPAGFLIPDGDAIVGAAGELDKVGDSFGKVFFCRSDVPLFQCDALCVGQVRDRTALLLMHRFQIFGDDPNALVDEKMCDFFLAGAHGNTHCNMAVGINADGIASAAAPDKRVGQLVEFALILDAYGVFHGFESLI